MKSARRTRSADLRIGISGWTYPPWRSVFYPERLPHRKELEYASRQFDSVEINGTFYGLQRPDSFRRWYDDTPPGFLFAIKGSRFITHMKKLREVRIPLANFFASGPLRLDEKLGPILWQFGPQWPLDLGRLEEFLELLPRDTEDAARLARRHDARLKGRAWTRIDRSRPLRHAIEPRHPSWFSERCVRLLRAHRVALVFADTAEVFPYAEDVTAPFVYLRLHGAGELYAGGYDEPLIEHWARRIEAWRCGAEPPDAKRIDSRPARAAKGRDVYVYFDNDAKVRAPFDALSLSRRLGRSPGCDADERLAGVDVAGLSRTPLTPEALEERRRESAQRWTAGLNRTRGRERPRTRAPRR